MLRPANVPVEVLAFNTNKEVAQFLRTIPKNSANGREAASKIYDPELFYKAVEKVVRSYPDLSNRPYFSFDKQRIQKDFPAIVTDEDILKNSAIILAYYERLMQFDLSVELAKLKELQKGARIADYDADGANIYEQALVNEHPAAGLSMRDAKWMRKVGRMKNLGLMYLTSGKATLSNIWFGMLKV